MYKYININNINESIKNKIINNDILNILLSLDKS